MRLRHVIALVLAAMIQPPLAGAPASLPASRPADRTIHVTELPLNLKDASPQQAEWLKEFIPKTREFDAECRDGPVDPDESWRMIRVTYPSPLQTPWPENNIVPAELYLPVKHNGKVPAAIVLDILDGSAVIPRGLARALAEQGIAALYVPMACYGVRKPAGNVHYAYFNDHPEKTAENMRQTVMDIRRGKALLAILPEIDATHISITGVSLGGIMTSLAAGVDGEFHRVIPILAGGDLSAIIFHARETRRIREACEAKGMSQAQLAEMLKPVEPLTFAKRIGADRCLMINATQDEVIPATSTAALREAIGMPKMLQVPAGHYRAILFLPDIRQRTIDFMLGKPVDSLK
jgi:dienelactone hydrolase